MEQEKKLNLIGLIIRIAIIAPAIIFGIMVMGSGVNAESASTDIESLKESVHFNAVFGISFVALLGCAALITRPASAVKSILGIIIATIFFFIAYAIGSTDTAESLRVDSSIMVTETTVNFATAGIWTAIVAMAIASIAALGLGFVLKLVRKN
jgi:hypothetical protein